jgi:2-desacetyl-2-hydroxyethyl bacteriochlorophyllide A dehydrogenase
MMTAARFHQAHQPLVLEQVEVPQPGPGEVLLEVQACGLCGSDLHILKGETFTGFTPIIMGHEAAGIVAELGPAVSGWQVGDRVAVNCVMSCGLCFNCQRGRDSICLERKLIGIHVDGALAKYVKVKARSLVPLPDAITFEQGAITTDAVATPYHALKARGGLRSGDSVAIIGAGGLGSHAVKLARIMGAKPVIAVDVSPEVLARARSFGADYVVNAANDDPVEAVAEITKGLGVDLALECVGSARTVTWAVQMTCVGGCAVVVGLSPESIDLGEITPFVRKEVALMGSSAFETKEIKELVDLAAAGRLDLSQSVSGTLSLKEINQGLERLEKNKGDIVRLVVNSF